MSDAVTIAVIGMVGTLLVSLVTATVAILTLLQGRSTHALVNGMHVELVSAEKGQSHAEGILQGESDQRDRAAAHAASGPVEVVGVADPSAEPVRIEQVEREAP